MVEIVRILERMRQHERRIELAVDVDHAIEMAFAELERVVAAIEELDFSAKQLGSTLGLVFAARLYFFQCGARFFPGELAFAALAERHADDFDPIATLGMQRDCSARAPNEITGMGRHHKPGLLIRHAATPFTYTPAC